jgi:hypothetical protein
VRKFGFHVGLILVIGILFYALLRREPESIVEYQYIYETDTLYIDKPPVYITKYVDVLKIDTVFVNDTVYITETAHIDTVFREGELSVSYYIIPQIFDIQWRPYPDKIVYVTQTTEKEYNPKWYERRDVNMLIGAFATGGLVWLIK